MRHSWDSNTLCQVKGAKFTWDCTTARGSDLTVVKKRRLSLSLSSLICKMGLTAQDG